MNWFYDAPDWIAMPVFIILFVAVSLAIVLVARPFIERSVKDTEQWDRVLQYVSGTFGVFYGILLALVVVSVYDNYVEAHAAALTETTKLGALYRGTSGLPEALGDDIRASLQNYVQTVITAEWPAQFAGRIPSDGSRSVDAMETSLYAFAPQTLQDHAVFTQLLATFDEFVEARRVRIDATTLQLPVQFWLVIWIGAIVNALLIAFVYVDDRGLHLLLAGLLALFVALVIYIAADMDHPYAGTISVGPDDFERLLEVIRR